jgi:quinol monooxygenase YgiN
MKKVIEHLAVLLILMGSAQAETTPPDPVYGVTYLEVSPNAADTAATLLRNVSEHQQRAPGNIAFAALRRVEHPGQFAILEVWRDAAAMAASFANDDTKQLDATLAPMLESPIDRRPQILLMTDPARTRAALGAASEQSQVVVTHVDLTSDHKADGQAAVRALDAAGGREPGNLAYDAVLQTNRQNHITMLEVWHDPASLRTHQASARTVQFRTEILPFSGAPYDERVYTIIR